MRTLIFGLIVLLLQISPVFADESGKMEVQAFYKSCTVYAGSTDYIFELPGGERLVVRNSNFPEEKSVHLVHELIDDSSDREGPPGPNPSWVGKKFVITYEGEKAVRIAPLE